MTPVWRRWAAGFVAWTILALLSASHSAVALTLDGQPVDWARLAPYHLIDWYTCAVFTPVFFLAARRYPVDGGAWFRHAPVHLALCAVATVLKFALQGATYHAIGWSTPSLGRVLQTGFYQENFAFWCMAAVVHAVEFQRRARERELLSARLRTRLASAQLDALAARLHPHFLFNTLQGISTLVHRDPVAADAMLGHLSSLLRRMLLAGPRHEVSLGEEVAVLEDYLAIAQARFGDRLIIAREVDPAAVPGLVPWLVLQPLVENALNHGISRRAGAGTVRIAASRDGEWMRIVVTDDGVGPPPVPAADGTGLGATRARLAELYQGRASLTIAPVPGGGTAATLLLPFHTSPVMLTGAAA